jgi:hypothetical protein
LSTPEVVVADGPVTPYGSEAAEDAGNVEVEAVAAVVGEDWKLTTGWSEQMHKHAHLVGTLHERVRSVSKEGIGNANL